MSDPVVRDIENLPRYGADRLVAEPSLLGAIRRVALATNDAARCAHDPTRRTRSALLDAGVPIVRLFSPEHGLTAAAADGTAVPDATDPLTGLPVVSLYGERFAPPAEALADLDAVLFDIPDVGARFYTYTWTLTHLIDACAAAQVPLVVLDRPNPLGGALASVEGPLLDPAYESFIGRHSIPIRHSLTLGEFALLWRNERRRDAEVRVIPCDGWKRDELWCDTGLPFVPTSPAITRFEAALLYPGLCLFEATNLSVGRGSPLSFEAIGAPWLDAAAVLERFAMRRMPGVDAVLAQFTPNIGAYSTKLCEGIRLNSSNPAQARPVRTAIALLADVMAIHQRDFEWSRYVTAANPGGEGHFERLVGRADIRAMLDRNPDTIDDALLDEFTSTPGWPDRWRSVLLYDLPEKTPRPHYQ